MIAPTAYPFFLLASLALLVIPGPAVLYVIARSVDQGRTAGMASALGLGIGNFVQVLAATAGLSALVLASPLAFNVVKYLGAGYLILLGARKMLSRREEAAEAGESAPRSLRQVFVQGVVVNTLNPKVALFFLAFLPQFVDPAHNPAGQVFFLGASFATLGICTDALYGILGGSAGKWLKQGRHFAWFERWFAGAVFIILGVITALTSRT